MILSLAGQQTVAQCLTLSKAIHQAALIPLFECVSLDKDSKQTVAFCLRVLSSSGRPRLRWLRHFTITTQAFYPPTSPSTSPLHQAGRKSKTWKVRCVSSKALRLFKQVLDCLAELNTLRTMRLEDPPQDILYLPAFDHPSPLSGCVRTASFFLQLPCQFRFQNISTLSLTLLGGSLAREVKATTIFPSLTSLSSSVDILDAFSHHHRLEHVTIRQSLLHRARPVWIGSFSEIVKLFSALSRVPIKSLAIGLALGARSDEMQEFFDRLADVASTLESLAITLRDPSSRIRSLRVAKALYVVSPMIE